MKIFGTIVISLILVALYQGLSDDRVGIQNRKGALFFLSLNSSFSGVSNASAIFPMERPVFLREVNNNMYTVSAYFWSKIFTEFPVSFLVPFILVTVSYFIIGFNTEIAYKYPMALLILTVSTNTFTGIGYILSVAVSDP
jgi:ATP-binding cassette, subfamily G (WHITE), member 2